MNANSLLKLMWMLALATSLSGCVIEDYVPGHVHGPECGHVLRGGIWVTVP